MSNTGQNDQELSGEYHSDINLLLERIAKLEKELNDTKYLLSISSNMIRALNATE